MRIIPQDAEQTPRPSNLKSWDSCSSEEQAVYSRMMEIYAAFLEFTDHNIGRVLPAIDETGNADNTLVIFN